jgi:hypothetical protein
MSLVRKSGEVGAGEVEIVGDEPGPVTALMSSAAF